MDAGVAARVEDGARARVAERIVLGDSAAHSADRLAHAMVARVPERLRDEVRVLDRARRERARTGSDDGALRPARDRRSRVRHEYRTRARRRLRDLDDLGLSAPQNDLFHAVSVSGAKGPSNSLCSGAMLRRRKVLSVVGTRPNMMKIAPIAAELGRRGDEFEHVLVHTGQHYDREMSEIFLEELGVGEPDYSLGVGSGSHAQQTAAVMERLEPVLLESEPDIVLVPGDVNSTMAASLTAAKLLVPIGHVEAGLRSFDRTMPEEINRIVADQLSQLLFIHSPEARDNLLAEGCPATAIHDVGNTMIDTLVAMRERIDAYGAPEKHGLPRGEYLVVTLHRPALVDGPLLAEAMASLAAVSRDAAGGLPGPSADARSARRARDRLPSASGSSCSSRSATSSS